VPSKEVRFHCLGELLQDLVHLGELVRENDADSGAFQRFL